MIFKEGDKVRIKYQKEVGTVMGYSKVGNNDVVYVEFDDVYVACLEHWLTLN